MSEKRFTYGETIDYNFFDVFEEKKYLGMIQRDSTKIVDRLNELAEENEQLQEEIKRLEKMIWKIQWRFQQEVGIKKAREHYREIDKEMNE